MTQKTFPALTAGHLVVLTMALLFAAAPARADEFTITQPILQLRYNGDADYAFFVGAARWGAPSCPNAQYAQVAASVAGRKQLLAIALAAKLAGARVNFQGICNAGNPDYFNVNYIVVEP